LPFFQNSRDLLLPATEDPKCYQHCGATPIEYRFNDGANFLKKKCFGGGGALPFFGYIISKIAKKSRGSTSEIE